MWEDLIVTGELEYVGTEIILNGNLSIREGGILSLIDSILIFNISSDWPRVSFSPQCRIDVEKNGELNIINSTITSSNSSIKDFRKYETYTFKIYGTANIIDSNISCMWMGSWSYSFMCGIQIFSNDVIIENSRIENNYGYGISIFNNSCTTILNCNISSNREGGIFLASSDLVIENTTFVYNGFESYGDDIFSWRSTECRIDILNCSLEHDILANIQYPDSAEISCSWLLNLNVIDMDENPISSANVTIFENLNRSFMRCQKTGVDGRIKNIRLKEYENSFTGIRYFTPHLVIVEKNGCIGYTEVLINRSRDITIQLDLNNPNTEPDNDNDNIPDSIDPDDDNDGYKDVWEQEMGTNPFDNDDKPMDLDDDGFPDGDLKNTQSWMDPDDDGDGYWDEWERFMGTNPNDPTEIPIDTDNDGLPDGDDENSIDSWMDENDDNDKASDKWDIFPKDRTQWEDRDGDGYGDNPDGNRPDPYPDDPNRPGEKKMEWRGWYIVMGGGVIILVIGVVIIVIIRKRRRMDDLHKDH